LNKPEIIELDGHKLAIPPNHPAFSGPAKTYELSGDGYTPIETLNALERRQCAAEAFAYWHYRGAAIYRKCLDEGRLHPRYDITDEPEADEYWQMCENAADWAKWGGLDKIAEGE
jgi:hypothetical protein